MENEKRGMENKTLPRVLIAIPCLDSIHQRVVGRLFQVILGNTEYIIDTLISPMRGIGENRNRITKAFLKGNYDWLLMVDSDNPPPRNVLQLIKEDKDVIGLPTPINMNWVEGVNNIYWSVFDESGHPIKEQGNGLQRVKKIGTGCILIKRKVLESIENPFTTVRGEDDVRIVGTDIAFCIKCNNAGFEIYTHWDYVCNHYKEIDLLSII